MSCLQRLRVSSSAAACRRLLLAAGVDCDPEQHGLRSSTTPCVASKRSYKMTKYGGRYFVTMLPGHGIGPEMMNHVETIFFHGKVTRGVVQSIKVITHTKSEQIARYGFEYARSRRRKKVTVVHKANIMKFSDGLFLETCRQVARDYPDIEMNDMIVDNCAMQLVSNPSQFDVVLVPNLYGNIVVNLTCGLVGGAGVTSGRNYGDEFAVFETATRNTGTPLVGKNLANPVATLYAAVDMLKHLGLMSHAYVIRDAILKTINVHKVHTRDIGGSATTTDVVESIVEEVRKNTR